MGYGYDSDMIWDISIDYESLVMIWEMGDGYNPTMIIDV